MTGLASFVAGVVMVSRRGSACGKDTVTRKPCANRSLRDSDIEVYPRPRGADEKAERSDEWERWIEKELEGF